MSEMIWTRDEILQAKIRADMCASVSLPAEQFKELLVFADAVTAFLEYQKEIGANSYNWRQALEKITMPVNDYVLGDNKMLTQWANQSPQAVTPQHPHPERKMNVTERTLRVLKNIISGCRTDTLENFVSDLYHGIEEEVS